MRKKAIIIYIATKGYVNYFDTFINSIDKFLPNTDKLVAIYTDNEELNVRKYENKHLRIAKYHIPDQPWPLVTLLKFHYIQNFLNRIPWIDVNYSHLYYFNANVMFTGKVIEDEFMTDKWIAVYHHAWTKVNHDYASLGNKIERSVANIEGPYEYMQADIFGGPLSLVRHMCKKVIGMCNYDLRRCIIPTWHDESYYNKALTQLKPELIDRKDEHIYNEECSYGDPINAEIKIVTLNSDSMQKLKEYNKEEISVLKDLEFDINY